MTTSKVTVKISNKWCIYFFYINLVSEFLSSTSYIAAIIKMLDLEKQKYVLFKRKPFVCHTSGEEENVSCRPRNYLSFYTIFVFNAFFKFKNI